MARHIPDEDALSNALIIRRIAWLHVYLGIQYGHLHRQHYFRDRYDAGVGFAGWCELSVGNSYLM